MIQVIEGGAYLKITGDAKELRRVADDLAYKNPKAYYSPSHQLYLRTKKSVNPLGWDGYVRPMKGTKETYKALRGWRDEILVKAEANNVEGDRSGMFQSPFTDLPPEEIPNKIEISKHELDDNQRICVAEWLKSGIGRHQVTVSGGKTMCFAAA